MASACDIARTEAWLAVSHEGLGLRRFATMQLGVLWLCAACASSPRPTCRVPDDVQLEIEASDRVNPDEDGRSLPTRLRLYQLKSLSRLAQASFDDVWARPKQTLADSALSSEELVIYPGQVEVHRFKRNPQADFIVGVAVFREPEGEAWRTAQEWPLPGDPCQRGGRHASHAGSARLEKLRLRMFLEGNRIESVNNYAQLPKRRCRPGSADCTGSSESSEARRNRRLKTFEEDPREPVTVQKPR
jgi:type VI secretion system protein VasD